MPVSRRSGGSGSPSGQARRILLADVLGRMLCIALLSGSVFAQEAPTSNGPATGAADAAQQQGTEESATGGSAAPHRAWSVVPRVTIKETYSDNVNLSATNPRDDWITDVAPGVMIEGRTRRLKMHASYDVHQLLYAQGSGNDQTQQALNAFGTLEAIDHFLFVDMSGTIAQQRISAFGSQSAGNYSVNSNSTETSTYRLSPYVKGRLGGYVDYEGRYTRTTQRNKSSAASDLDSNDWLGRLSGDTPLAALGWSADAEHQTYDYHPGRPSTSDHVRGLADIRVTPELRLSVSAGRERNDFLTPVMESYGTHGAGLDWRPTERTDVSLFKEKRFFGDGHTVSISHRMRRSSFKYTDSRDVSVLPNQSGLVGLGTFYDLLFAQFASSIPDEATRAAFVNALLAAYGVPANAVVTADFISSRVMLQRRQEFAYVLTGVRNVVTVAVVKSQNDQLGSFIIPGLGTGMQNNTSILQRGINLGWAHKLSALSSLNVMASHMRSEGTANNTGLETTQKVLSAALSSQLSARTQGSLMLRRTLFSSTTAPYSEDAIIGTVSFEF